MGSGSTGFMLASAVLLIVGAVVAVVAQRRTGRAADDLSDLDAEAEANGWLVRLGASLSGLDVREWARADENAAQALAHATDHHRKARAQLASARTSAEYTQVSRTAAQGLRHVEEARAALGARWEGTSTPGWVVRTRCAARPSPLRSPAGPE
ncbi:hypothetical protein ACFYWX_03265 [Streptomyces sp. NPDC002888]|uniref:hypothetical protein n=1 Tax=Streptomyces sp. NPDC002888 TaxID=3364668 RepID=UPI003683452E